MFKEVFAVDTADFKLDFHTEEHTRNYKCELENAVDQVRMILIRSIND